MNSIITNNNFKSPVIGHDSISGGTFIIQRAWMLFDEEEMEYGVTVTQHRAQGKITITSGDNPLYQIAKEEPLRLQGLIASVQFGIEKRFIKIQTISSYEMHLSMGNTLLDNIELNPVTFEILDGLEYLEGIVTYREDHLL